MKRLQEKNARRTRRKAKIRKQIKGTPERPRMSVFRSNRHVYVQVIDDIAGTTLVSVSSLQKEFKDLSDRVEDAAKIGEAIGNRLKERKIGTVVFDRNGYLYHGVVKAVAEGARKAGIEVLGGAKVDHGRDRDQRPGQGIRREAHKTESSRQGRQGRPPLLLFRSDRSRQRHGQGGIRLRKGE